MIKPLSQQAKEQDGYRPPFTMLDETFLLDEMSADMSGKYRPAFTAKPSPLLVMNVQLSEETRRANPSLLYGNADHLSSMIDNSAKQPISSTDSLWYGLRKGLKYGEQIEPLDDQTMSIIQRIQREVDEAAPEQMKEWTQRYEALAHSLGKPMKDGDCNDQTEEA